MKSEAPTVIGDTNANPSCQTGMLFSCGSDLSHAALGDSDKIEEHVSIDSVLLGACLFTWLVQFDAFKFLSPPFLQEELEQG